MKDGHIRKFSIIFITITLIFQCCYAKTIDKIIVFGDSLSDNGNIFSLTTKAHNAIPMIPPIPKNPPYFEGRFSNGPVWVDNLAQALSVEQVNYAYAGAWAEPVQNSALIIPFGLGMQVNFYLVSSVLDFHKDRHLYIIWSGANDYINGRSDSDYPTSNTVASIQNQIDWLIYYGAKNFLVLNMPDLGIIPGVIAEGPDFATAVSKLALLHNKKFASMIQKEKETNLDVNIMFIDIIQYFSDIMTHPEKYHLKNVTQACYNGGYWLKRNMLNAKELQAAQDANIDILMSPSLKAAYVTAQLYAAGEKPCANPDEYFFWDQVHPTRVVHNLISALALSLLSENDIHGYVR
ncbi:MAG: SGNH/GDSL hydrolase family protein [Gammaproteobacteria bacterium]|nr:SGNH/GDSL hydrolase family protein [Gammaproteobacteria bacterium]MCW5584086.1 SGNH/GDSL hydrolase family protein [Gammaproteobacteria bacterium]